MREANHPSESQLALFVGKDLGFWELRRVRGHVSHCALCRTEVRALQESCRELRPLAAEPTLAGTVL